MKKMVRFMTLSLTLLGFVFTTGCYKEQHFDFPGPFEDTSFVNVVDSLPFPFDKTRQAGVWLMKDNVPDFGKILFKGYTDYRPMHDTVSWVQEPTGMRLIPHRNYYPLTDADHLGGDPNSYKYNWAYSKYFVPVGAGKSFYMYAKVSFGTFSGTAAGLVLGASWSTGGVFVFGMDGNSSIAPMFFVDLYGTLGATVSPDQGWPTANEVIIPGVPAEIEVVIHDNLFYIKVNGTLCFLFKISREDPYYFTPQIRPWRNFVTVHDFYVESSDMYSVDYALHEHQQDYNRIQAPALVKAGNGDLLLFAEGRSNPASAEERVAQNTMPVGNTDIIMSRSGTGGQTWDQQVSVIAGAGSGDTYGFPQVVTTSGGKMILHYSKLTTTSLKNGSFSYPAEQLLYQTVSTDNGLSWSQPVNITESLKDVSKGYLKSSSGHGIELRSAAYKNRLVMPLIYGGTSIKVGLSDDQGASWRTSQLVGGSNITAGSVVELADARLMLILSHGNASPQSKLVSYSSDGGETWTAPVPIAAGAATLSNGHMYAGIAVSNQQGTIYFANATGRQKDPETYNGPNFGITPVLFESTDNGASFTSTGPLFTRTAYRGYSDPIGNMDAVFTNDGKLVIVGEGGVESPQEGIVVYRR
ncbi:sialidase family protein [Niabella aurantiaca]|uniref:sialidase family protein n=1 Tax=Niabella aurantiaca TaxID=379900 RepID=UPI00146C895C|nr:sialidase family protein [Niabella aurantiaca]